MQKRIGIVTWYEYENYGTALQAVALNKVVEELGFTAVDIAYNPAIGSETHEREKKPLSKRLFNKIRYFHGLRPISDKGRSEKFKKFVHSNIALSPEVHSKSDLSELSNMYSAFICGSDQIWSPRFFDSTYYLSFVDDKRKLIAYAPSFGCDSINTFSSSDEIALLLSRFNHIGVREQTAALLVESMTGNLPPVVLDPTLLLSAEDWKEYSCPTTETSSYCLVYFLGSEKRNWAAAKMIAEEKGLRLLVIPVFQRDLSRKNVTRYPVGPAEFLSLIANAKLVCTDSFHGIVFSTIFKRDFIAFERFDPKSRDSQNTRIYSYLELINSKQTLLSRVHLSNWRDYVDIEIDHEMTCHRIEVLKRESLQYLNSALETATSEGRE